MRAHINFYLKATAAVAVAKTTKNFKNKMNAYKYFVKTISTQETLINLALLFCGAPEKISLCSGKYSRERGFKGQLTYV